MCADLSKTFLYPTDTILGLGCSALDIESIKKIYQIKQREESKSLIILVESERRLQNIVDVPDLAWDIIDCAVKPVTIVYDNPKNIPKELIAEDNTIAIRLTNNPICKKLITTLNAPIVSTSANISGESSPKTLKEVSPQIINQVDYILPECNTFIPEFSASSIIKLSQNGIVKIIRE